MPLIDPPCHCRRCALEANAGRPFVVTHMTVCPLCGNKRCPHAEDHRARCTRSNALWQTPDLSAAPYHYTECGLSSVWLTNGFLRSQDEAGGTAIAVQATTALDRAIGRALVSLKPFLHGRDIRFLRGLPEPGGLSQAELGQLLGVSGAEVALWEHNREWLPRPTETLLRLWVLDETEALGEGQVAPWMRQWASQDRPVGDTWALLGTWDPEKPGVWTMRVGDSPDPQS